MALYTSSYDAMLMREKKAGDVYIQVSRDLGHFENPDDTTGLAKLIGARNLEIGGTTPAIINRLLEKKICALLQNICAPLTDATFFFCVLKMC